MTTSFATIVVGVDGREGGRDAVALAKALSTGARLILAVAYPFETPSVHRAAMRLLEHEREAAGVHATLVPVHDGSPARALHAVAIEHDADLLVVGSSHHTRFGRALVGDVGRGAVRHAPCPVAVAPRAYERARLGTIGVGFDGSPEAAEALDLAHALAGEGGCLLRIYVVAQLPESSRPYAHPDDWARVRDRMRREAEGLLHGALAGLGYGASGEAVVGDAADVLVSASREVDLLVVGSRGWGPLRRVVSGSTSDHLLHHAACPVLIAPRRPTEGASAGKRAVRATAPA